MSRPTSLLIRVDSLVYAQTVYVFKKDEKRLYWWNGGSGVTYVRYTTIDNVDPTAVRHLKMKEVV